MVGLLSVSNKLNQVLQTGNIQGGVVGGLYGSLGKEGTGFEG